MTSDVLRDLESCESLERADMETLEKTFQDLVTDEAQEGRAKLALSRVRIRLREVLCLQNPNPELQNKLSALLYNGSLVFAQRESQALKAKQEQFLQSHHAVLNLLHDCMMNPTNENQDRKYLLSVNPYRSQEALEDALEGLENVGLIDARFETITLSPEGWNLIHKPQ